MTKQIASIYYIALEARRQEYGGKFNMSAVPKGSSPAILTVPDHRQVETLPYSQSSHSGRRDQVRRVVLGEEIAPDILAEWTERNPDASPSCAPGMWIVRDVIPIWHEEGESKGNALIDADGRQQHRDTTAEEKAAMFAEDLAAAIVRQDAWVERCVQKGDIMDEDIKKRPFIPEYCKAAALYRGDDRKWLHVRKASDIVSCPWCRKSVDAEAIVCSECGRVVNPAREALMKTQQKLAAEVAVKRQAAAQPQEAA
jgi:hypothetical protein